MKIYTKIMLQNTDKKFNYKKFLHRCIKYLQKLYTKKEAIDIVNQLIFFYLSEKEEGKLKLLPQRIKKSNLKKFLQAFRNITKGIAIQYVTKNARFYGRDFYIQKGVFIPRLDTEYLIDLVLKKINNNVYEKINFLDIGVGSGALAITILLQKPNTHATGVDINKKALKIAFLNSCRYNTQNKLDIIYSDVFEHLDNKYYNKFDFIISNPPYVPYYRYKKLHKSIFCEPKNAIVANNNGNEVIEKILSGYKRYLKEKGFLAFEFPWYNLNKIKRLFLEKNIVNSNFYKENNTGFAVIENGS